MKVKQKPFARRLSVFAAFKVNLLLPCIYPNEFGIAFRFPNHPLSMVGLAMVWLQLTLLISKI